MMRNCGSTWVVARAVIPLASLLALSGWCQQSRVGMRNYPAVCLNLDDSGIASEYREIRTIEDLGTHKRWMLLRDLRHPAAPALLVQQIPGISCALRTDISTPSASDVRSVPLTVIHAGDYLIVSEHTRILDAELEAMALKPAAIGDSLTVRLRFGGRILSAVATAPGRATFSGEASKVQK
jgi:hypothetical protein